MAEIKKQYENRVNLTGVLKEFKVIHKDEAGADKIPMKIVNAIVETTEGEEHRVSMMAMKSYKDKKDPTKRVENKNYKAIETMEERYVSKEDVANGAEGNATVVNVFGSLEVNMYKDKNTGEVRENPQIVARNISENKNANPEDFGATFTLTVYVSSRGVRLTDAQGEETDQVKFKGFTVDYRGQAHPFEFSADDENGVASYFEDDVEVGSTMTLQGKIYNKYIVKEVVRQSENSIGKPIVDTKRETDRRILVIGGNVIEEDTPSHIDSKTAKEAMEKYEAAKVDIKSKEDKKEEVKKGITGVKKKTTAIDEDSLPF